MVEYILCAANWYPFLELKRVIDDGLTLPKNLDHGIVFCGHRHPQCMYQMISLTGLKQHEAGGEVQGFLTSKNRFVDRKEACEIFKSLGGKPQFSNTELYSEDLYNGLESLVKYDENIKQPKPDFTIKDYFDFERSKYLIRLNEEDIEHYEEIFKPII